MCTCVNMNIIQYCTHIYIYIYVSINICIYIYIFKHYVYLVYIHPNISCRPFVVYLRFRQQAQHVSRTLLCSQSPKTCAFFRQARRPGFRMTQITHPKNKVDQKCNNGSVQHLFFCFTSKTRPWKFCKLLLRSNGFFDPKISMVSKSPVDASDASDHPRICWSYPGNSVCLSSKP